MNEDRNKKKKVIFIDDDKNLLKSIQRLLYSYRNKWDLKFINEPISGLDIVLKEVPDILFVDYSMPGINGLDLLRSVREHLPETKLVLFSGQSDEDIFNTAKKVVDFYLEKPCDHKKIIELIDSI